MPPRRCLKRPPPGPSPAPQLARVREEASTAKSEAGRARAEADFERDRSTRLAESVEMQRQQVGSPLAMLPAVMWAGAAPAVTAGAEALLPRICGALCKKGSSRVPLWLPAATPTCFSGMPVARPAASLARGRPCPGICPLCPTLYSPPLLPAARQIESMIGSNAKYQALLTDTERKLAQAQAAADEARDTVSPGRRSAEQGGEGCLSASSPPSSTARCIASRTQCCLPRPPVHLCSRPPFWLRQARREGMRAEGLEAEKKLLAAAERRAAGEAADLSRDKFRLAAELEAARKVHADREGELVREVARLKEEVRGRGLGGAPWLASVVCRASSRGLLHADVARPPPARLPACLCCVCRPSTPHG